ESCPGVAAPLFIVSAGRLLMLMREGGALPPLIKFCIAMRPPKVVWVSAQAAIIIAALGAEALAHSASKIASASLGATTPGAPQLLEGCEGGAGGWTCVNEADVYPSSPNVERNLLQSAALKTSVFSIRTIVCPWPEMPAAKTGFRL